MIYFDNSATTQVAPEVLQTYNTVSQKIWGNPSSLHNFGEEAWNKHDNKLLTYFTLIQAKSSLPVAALKVTTG